MGIRCNSLITDIIMHKISVEVGSGNFVMVSLHPCHNNMYFGDCPSNKFNPDLDLATDRNKINSYCNWSDHSQ